MNEIRAESSLNLPSVDYSERTERLIKKIQSFREGEELYELAFHVGTLFRKNGPWKIQFKEDTFHSSVKPNERTIRLNPSSSEMNNLSDLLFELINISQMTRFNELEMSAIRGKIKREDFAKEMERVEFKTCQTHHSIVAKAIKEMGWPKSIDEFFDYGPDVDFNMVWEKIKNFEHAERYRKFWDDLQAFKEDRPQNSAKLDEVSSESSVVSSEGSDKSPSSRFQMSDVEDESADLSPVSSESSAVSSKGGDESPSSRFTIIDVDEDDSDLPSEVQ